MSLMPLAKFIARLNICLVALDGLKTIRNCARLTQPLLNSETYNTDTSICIANVYI